MATQWQRYDCGYKQQRQNHLMDFMKGLVTELLLEYDSASNRFFQFLDLKRVIRQTTRLKMQDAWTTIIFRLPTPTKMFYFGASTGIPVVSYTSTTTARADDRDSMRVTFTSQNAHTSTYLMVLPVAYSGHPDLTTLLTKNISNIRAVGSID